MSAETRQHFDPGALVREAVRGQLTYVPSRSAVPPARSLIRLDMNESPYGPSPKAREALASFDQMHRYPDFEQWELREAIGRYVDKAPEQIICGAGLDDVLHAFARALLEPGDEVIISEPTFGVYRSEVNSLGGVIVNVQLGPGFSLDPGGVLAAITSRTKYIVICTPNNPTGNDLDPYAIENIVDAAPCFVAIDEAYAEFSNANYVDFIDRYPNVVVFRTMSKFAGLAGMRVGYGIFPAAAIDHFRSVVPPFHNVSLASRAVAIASLDDLEYLNAVVLKIIASREALAANLREIEGVHPYPSSTNFILVKLPVVNAAPVVQALADRGILVRGFPRPDLGIQKCLRVTTGSTDENESFLSELEQVLAAPGMRQ